jgi:hypothetical protein
MRVRKEYGSFTGLFRKQRITGSLVFFCEQQLYRGAVRKIIYKLLKLV